MEELMNYIQPELLVLIPVLYLVGMGIKKTATIEDRWIPAILGVLGIIFAVMYGMIDCGICLEVVWVGIIQGILCAGCSVYANQLVKQVGN